MPKPAHAKITHSGIFRANGQPIEIWSWSVGLSGAPSTGSLTGAAAAAREAYTASIAPLMPTGVVLTRTRVSSHTAGAGRVEQDPVTGSYSQGDDDTQVPGIGSSSANLPLQTACCVSLETARPGPRGRGRFFLPALASTIGSDFRWTADAAFGAASLAVAYLEAVQTSLGVEPVVVSTFGFSTPVTQVRCGRVPDTMRSRRGELVEDYVTVPLPI